MSIETLNPATGQVLKTYENLSNAEASEKAAEADKAFQAWKETSFQERAQCLRKAAGILKENAQSYAKLMAEEMGKPIAQGKAESEKCAWLCDYYADHAAKFLEPESIETGADRSYAAFEPLGVLLAIMPWNFPFWQVFRAAAPALMAGNTVLLKHASNVVGCALTIEKIFREAGLPEGAFTALILRSRDVASLIEDTNIKAVTLTGSVSAGRSVGEAAGKSLKKTVLELGGSDPYVVLADADLEAAAGACAASRLINGGQSCIAAKRFIVVSSVRKEFQERFVEEMKKRKVGDPFEEGVEVGPLARTDLRDELHRQVRESAEKGAEILCGGEIPSGEGAFYPPTVLTSVRPGMPAYEEETFGPVASIIEAKDEEDAIRAANDSCFGLGAAVFTRDVEKGEQIARKKLQAGCCFVNAVVKSDPRLPFGGIKESGYGRELGVFGIREFVNIKTVYVS